VLGAEVEIDERLAPGATPDGVREAVEQRGDTVVAVAHQPDVAWIATVLGRSPSVADFPPAGLAVLELP
jgi:phosphohistidine phosphatase SixA